MEEQAIVDLDELTESSTEIPFDAAHAALGKCFKRGVGDSFIDQVRQKLDNPSEPADSKGLKRIHPYVLSAVIVLLIGSLVFLYFTIAG
jgi:hypothetical protein